MGMIYSYALIGSRCIARMRPVDDAACMELEVRMNMASQRYGDGFGVEGAGERIMLDSLSNTRDLGGLPTQDGRKVKHKRLIRSGTLTRATEKDIDVLVQEYKVRHVIDLRTDDERKNAPDPIEEFIGVRFVNIPLMSAEALGVTRTDMEKLMQTIKTIAANPVSMMTSIYPAILTDENSRVGLRQFFQELLSRDEEEALLWHCTAGKDRVGLSTVLLLKTLGVPWEIVVQDYLATNKYMHENTREIEAALDAYNVAEELRESLLVLNSADVRFLQSAIDAVDIRYGGLDAYIREALGVDKEAQAELRLKYLAE